MEVFRISAAQYAEQLTSSGNANRWNQSGQSVIYTGSSRSLSTLELVVHRSAIKPTITYKVMVLSIADDDRLINQIKTNDLPINWRSMIHYPDLQRLGSDWYTSQSALVLKVPSAVIPQEFNYVINLKHPDFEKHVKLIRTEPYFWDDRLI